MPTPLSATSASIIGSKPEITAPPPGWWSLRDMSGSLAGVIAAIESAPDVPVHWKEAIKSEVVARCVDGMNFVYLDAHCMVEKGNVILHVSVTPDKKLL